jgi:hypothetical protein
MPKGVGYLITIAFKIPIVLGIGTQNGCDFAGYTWFFGNTDLHFDINFLYGFPFAREWHLKLQSKNLEIGIEMKFLGVMNGWLIRSFFRSKTIGVFKNQSSSCPLYLFASLRGCRFHQG